MQAIPGTASALRAHAEGLSLAAESHLGVDARRVAPSAAQHDKRPHVR